MKVEALIEAVKKILKSYKKEIESSINVSIIEYLYFDESTKTFRRQIIIDYDIQHRREKVEEKDRIPYHI